MSEKLKSKIKCILCRTGICGVKQELQWKGSSRDFKLWNDQCVNSLSESLFKTESHPYKYFLSTGGYCLSCQKTVWDLDFTHRQLQKLKIRMDELTKRILKALETNYQTSVEETEERQVRERLGSKDDEGFTKMRTSHTLDFVKSKNFDYDEAIEVIYEVLKSGEMFKEVNPCGEHTSVKPKVELSPPESKTSDTPDARCSLNFDLSNSIEIKDEVSCECDDSNNHDENDCFHPFENTDHADQYELSNPDFPEKLEDDEVKSPLVNTTTDEVPMDIHVPDVPGPSCSFPYRNDGNAITSEEDETSNSDEDYSDDDRIKSKGKRERVKFKCVVEECPKAFYSRAQMNTHYKTFHLGEEAEKPHQCDKCERKYRYANELRRHMKEYHTNDLNDRLDHACPVCSKSFETLPELDAHCVIHKGDNPYKCEDCHQEFIDSDELKRHVNEIHAVVPRPMCSICGKQFRTAFYVKRHERQIHPEAFGIRLKCRCGATFETAKLRYDHKKTVHKKTFQCDYCDKSFPSTTGLKTHVQTHSEDRPFKCKLCDASFKNSSNLKYHEIRHSGVYNYMCDICGKPFPTKHNLRRHTEIHKRYPTYRPRKPRPSLIDTKAKQTKELIGNEESEPLAILGI